MSDRNWQGIPDWLIYAVRREHAAAIRDGAQSAGEDAVENLAARVLRDDPEFTRVIVTRYLRTLVRAPKARKRGKPGERERLMADCARMSAEGMSLRAIGERVDLSHTAVRKILAEWETRLPEMDPALIRRAMLAGTPAVNLPVAGFTPQVSADPNVIPLRRLA